jgi:hypothetical protein
VSPPKVEGAKPWARAPALNATETNAVASAKKIRGLRTSARYAGNHKLWQAFFSTKIVGHRSLTGCDSRRPRSGPPGFQSPGR